MRFIFPIQTFNLKALSMEEKSETEFSTTVTADRVTEIVQDMILRNNENLMEMFRTALSERTPSSPPLDSYLTADSSYKPKTPNPRRHSSWFEHGESRGGESPETSTVREPAKAGLNIIHQFTEIPDKDKMHSLTPKAIMIFKKKMDMENAIRNVPRKFQEYMSEHVMSLLWDREVRIQTDFGKYSNLDELYRVSLSKFMTIAASYCRPKNTKEYTDQLIYCLSAIGTTTKVPHGYKLSDKDYDQYLCARFSKHATIVKEDEFARTGATPEEITRLPRHELGSDKEAEGIGVFSIALATLGEEYALDYRRQIGDEKLKRCKSLEEFLDLFQALNRKLADLSENERKTRDGLAPKPSFKDIAAKVSSKSNDSPETIKRVRQYQDAKKRLFVVQESELNASINTPDMSNTEEPSDASVRFDEVHQGQEDIFEQENELKYVGKDSRDSEGKGPCFDYFEGKCTLGSKCAYSHDRSVQEQYGEELLAKFMSKIKNALKVGVIKRDKVFSALKDLDATPVSRSHVAFNPQETRHHPAGRGGAVAGRGLFPAGRGSARLQLLTNPEKHVQCDDSSDLQHNG